MKSFRRNEAWREDLRVQGTVQILTAILSAGKATTGATGFTLLFSILVLPPPDF
jgi:hypothetical protein